MWARHRSRTKTRLGGEKFRPAAGGRALLKGGGGTRVEGGSRESFDAWGGAGERERGPERSVGQRSGAASGGGVAALQWRAAGCARRGRA
jgi:hypothetical protein